MDAPWLEPAPPLGGREPGALAAAARAAVHDAGVTFGALGDERFHLDPVPRVIEAAEWSALAAGLGQRLRALDAWCADCYGARRIVADGVVPARVIDTCEWFEPADPPLPLDDLPSLLAGTLAAANGGDPPRPVVLTDGPHNAAHWEHGWLAQALGIPLVEPDELVIKRRSGYGGVGVVIAPHAEAADVERLRRAVQQSPGDYIAQELVVLSRHPTVIDGELAPRHVDLRPFAFLDADGQASVLPGGLTRVAFDEGALVVNSSQNGGAKDTWVLPS